MDFNEYQNKSYIAIQDHENNKEEVMHWAIGLGEEAGEALSVIKHRYYGGKYDVEDLVSELGDVLWYIAALCTANGIKLEDIAKYNIARLYHRYPTLEFDDARSKSRHQLDGNFRQSVEAQIIMEKIKGRQNSEGIQSGAHSSCLTS